MPFSAGSDLSIINLDVKGTDMKMNTRSKKSETTCADDEIGMIWWNHISEREREKWMRLAGDTGVAADAWAAFQASQHHTNRE